MPRKTPDGTLMFPAKGKPPKPMDGYYAASDYVHKPLLKPCQYRGFQNIKRDCECPDRVVLSCEVKGRIHVGSCLGCVDRKQSGFIEKAVSYGEALVFGKKVSDEEYTRRITTCQRCPYGKGDVCSLCGCNVFELARYIENLPKWGCKHPERGKLGWSV